MFLDHEANIWSRKHSKHFIGIQWAQNNNKFSDIENIFKNNSPSHPSSQAFTCLAPLVLHSGNKAGQGTTSLTSVNRPKAPSQCEVGKTSRGTVKFSHRHDCVEQVWEKVSWTFVKKLFVSLECDPMFLWKNCPIFLAKWFQCENMENVNDFCEHSKNDFQFWQIFFHPPYFQERASDHIHGHKEEDLVNFRCACLDILLFCSVAIIPGTWHLSCEFTQLELHSWFSWWNSGSPRWILLVSLPQTLSWSAPPR